MEVFVARVAGFCYGVDRAYDIVQNALEKKGKGDSLSTFGPLIHNDRVIQSLEEKEVSVVEDLEKAEGTMIVRSHGISNKKKNALAEKSKELIDATCPYVTKVHVMAQAYQKQGRTVIVVGDPKHPEMRGIIEDLEDPICVQTVEEAKQLDRFEKLGVVCQTTIRREKFREVCDILEGKTLDIKIYDTICTATSDRQDAIRELAQNVDAVIVVGGTKSSNTKKLEEVASEFCVTQKVECPEQVDLEMLKGKKKVGVTAGASTPQYQIDEMVDFLSTL